MNQICLCRRSCLGRMRRETNESRIRRQTRNMGGKRVIGQHGGSRGLVNQVPDMLTGSLALARCSCAESMAMAADTHDSAVVLMASLYGRWQGGCLLPGEAILVLESVLGLTRALVAVAMVQGGGG